MTPPVSRETLESLRRVRDEARQRGDETMAVLLSGIELYATLGKEDELLEVMRTFADSMRPIIENTPSAADLKQLYERDDPYPPPRAG